MHNRTVLILTTASLMAAAPAFAQVAATTATDLNLRAGPGPDQPIVEVIPSGGVVTVQGCLEAANWCQVDFAGTTGWAYGDYLNASAADQPEPLVVYANREALQIPAITVENVEATAADATDKTVSAAAGATLAGAIIGGPAAILAGAALGATLPNDDPAVTYVRANPTDPVLLEGEIVVGAGIPPEVELVAIPDTNWGYLNVNGLPVIVDTGTRQIVTVVR